MTDMGKVKRPSIPSRSVSILDFCGNGNGIYDNTEAFAEAIDYLHSRGGGHLIVPEESSRRSEAI